MDTWVFGLVCNAIIAVVHMLIAVAVIVPLATSRELRTNPLGAATAAIFFTCSVHKADRALTTAIGSATKMITDLLGSEYFANTILRSAPAVTSAGPVDLRRSDSAEQRPGEPRGGRSTT